VSYPPMYLCKGGTGIPSFLCVKYEGGPGIVLSNLLRVNSLFSLDHFLL
jgi:hypothetical protein